MGNEGLATGKSRLVRGFVFSVKEPDDIIGLMETQGLSLIALRSL